MQTICTSLQTETTPTPHHSDFTGQMLFLTPNRVKALEGTIYCTEYVQTYYVVKITSS